jgi:hypothetical protein
VFLFREVFRVNDFYACFHMVATVVTPTLDKDIKLLHAQKQVLGAHNFMK